MVALKGWEKVKQSFIDDFVESIPQRLKDCIKVVAK